jgi:aerobic-type carbon monoxide dehydrogenase small subunit (CoxS/CutS family)
VLEPQGSAQASLRIRLQVNGEEREGVVEGRTTLADFLRDQLGLTGTHLGCEHGVCGACTVLLDSLPTRSCLVLAVSADGCRVETVEGLARNGQLSRLQRAMWDSHSFQCGFCTPGFLIQAAALLAENPTPTEAEVRQALSGNLCRCTGYESIVRGVLAASEGRERTAAVTQ